MTEELDYKPKFRKADKRHNNRIPMNTPVIVFYRKTKELADAVYLETNGTVRDVSQEGIAICIPRDLKPFFEIGEYVKFQYVDAELHRKGMNNTGYVITGVCCIVHIEEKDEGVFIGGKAHSYEFREYMKEKEKQYAVERYQKDELLYNQTAFC